MQNPDRNVRREAYLAWASLYEGISQDLDRIYDELVKVRVEMARKLGFDNYTALGYLNNKRMDYTREDVAKFRQQVKRVIVPFCEKIRKEQAKRIGVDKIKYYDESFMFPEGNPNPVGNKDQMIAWAQEMYNEMSKETGSFSTSWWNTTCLTLRLDPGSTWVVTARSCLPSRLLSYSPTSMELPLTWTFLRMKQDIHSNTMYHQGMFLLTASASQPTR